MPGAEADATFHAPPELRGETLAAALRQWLPGQSWKQVRDLVSCRQVSINGNLCMDAARRLNAGDVVKAHAAPKAAPPAATDVAIVFADAHLAVAHKPSGMTTVRHREEARWPLRRKQLQPTLDELLPALLVRHERRRPAKGARPPAVRAVHRLDRDTSGLLVFARTAEAQTGLGKQFREHTVHRRYLAFVAGRADAARLESRLALDRGDGRRGSTTVAGVGQHAVTHVRPLEFFPTCTLVECRLETGRTHQIRIHLSEAGHHVLGDRTYNAPVHQPPVPDPVPCPRLALHAAELGFRHPVTERPLNFSARLPPDLAELQARLKAARGT